MTTYAKLGSVSSGTMRPEDLIPVFFDLVVELDGRDGPHALLLRAMSDRIDTDGYYETEGAWWDLDDLQGWLDAFVPPYCYFGAHEGDGADYGFWISWDSLREAEHDGEVIRVDDPGEIPVKNDGTSPYLAWGEASYAFHVDDHGRATLYDRAGNEVWSA